MGMKPYKEGKPPIYMQAETNIVTHKTYNIPKEEQNRAKIWYISLTIVLAVKYVNPQSLAVDKLHPTSLERAFKEIIGIIKDKWWLKNNQEASH